MATWIVRLDGDPDDLNALVDLGVSVTRGSDGVVFRSPELDTLSDARLVRDLAIKSIAALCGLSRIAEGDDKARVVTVGAIFREDGTRRDTFLTPESVELRLRVRAANLKGSGDTESPVGKSYPEWAAAAGRDPNVKLALQYFGPEPSAESLWKVYEVIRADVGGKTNIINNGWATATEIDSFRSVHYPSALGEKARHGTEPKNQSAPISPMSLGQARQFVGRLLRRWLASK
jgi:hypothetical protein